MKARPERAEYCTSETDAKCSSSLQELDISAYKTVKRGRKEEEGWISMSPLNLPATSIVALLTAFPLLVSVDSFASPFASTGRAQLTHPLHSP